MSDDGQKVELLVDQHDSGVYYPKGSRGTAVFDDSSLLCAFRPDRSQDGAKFFYVYKYEVKKLEGGENVNGNQP